MTKYKNPRGKKSLSKRLAVLKVKWFFWSGAAACTERDICWDTANNSPALELPASLAAQE